MYKTFNGTQIIDIKSGNILISNPENYEYQKYLEWVAAGNTVSAFEVKIVTMRQARLALLQSGLLTLVQTAIDSLPEPQKTAAKIEWDYSSEVHRDSAFVQTLTIALGLTPQQLEDLFNLAYTL